MKTEGGWQRITLKMLDEILWDTGQLEAGEAWLSKLSASEFVQIFEDSIVALKKREPEFLLIDLVIKEAVARLKGGSR